MREQLLQALFRILHDLCLVMWKASRSLGFFHYSFESNLQILQNKLVHTVPPWTWRKFLRLRLVYTTEPTALPNWLYLTALNDCETKIKGQMICCFPQPWSTQERYLSNKFFITNFFEFLLLLHTNCALSLSSDFVSTRHWPNEGPLWKVGWSLGVGLKTTVPLKVIIFTVFNWLVLRYISSQFTSVREIDVWNTTAQGRDKVRWRPGKEEVRRLHVRTGLSEANVLYWRK